MWNLSCDTSHYDDVDINDNTKSVIIEHADIKDNFGEGTKYLEEDRPTTIMVTDSTDENKICVDGEGSNEETNLESSRNNLSQSYDKNTNLGKVVYIKNGQKVIVLQNLILPNVSN